ncbi:MAG: hypothetical protein ACYTHK_06960 [Planctomycetota bacterium]
MRSILVPILLLLACSSGAKRTELTPAELEESRERFHAAIARDHAENAQTFLRRIGAKARAGGGA